MQPQVVATSPQIRYVELVTQAILSGEANAFHARLWNGVC